jgi:hypothetical protein
LKLRLEEIARKCQEAQEESLQHTAQLDDALGLKKDELRDITYQLEDAQQHLSKARSERSRAQRLDQDIRASEESWKEVQRRLQESEERYQESQRRLQDSEERWQEVQRRLQDSEESWQEVQRRLQATQAEYNGLQEQSATASLALQKVKIAKNRAAGTVERTDQETERTDQETERTDLEKKRTDLETERTEHLKLKHEETYQRDGIQASPRLGPAHTGTLTLTLTLILTPTLTLTINLTLNLTLNLKPQPQPYLLLDERISWRWTTNVPSETYSMSSS